MGYQPTEPRPERLDWDFEADVREKKNLANQSRHRKCGVRSKKCSFPSDYLTKKQWKERCGAVVSCNLKKPMLWKEFCGLSTSLQKLYLTNLVQQYHTTASDLAKMFGVHPQTVVKRCGMPGIDIHFGVGQRMSKMQREAFDEFCEGGVETCNVEQEPKIDLEKATVPIQEETVSLAKQIHEAPVSDNMAITDFSLTFQGVFNVDMVANTLRSMVPRDIPVKIDIKCMVTPNVN